MNIFYKKISGAYGVRPAAFREAYQGLSEDGQPFVVVVLFPFHVLVKWLHSYWVKHYAH